MKGISESKSISDINRFIDPFWKHTKRNSSVIWREKQKSWIGKNSTSTVRSGQKRYFNLKKTYFNTPTTNTTTNLSAWSNFLTLSFLRSLPLLQQWWEKNFLLFLSSAFTFSTLGRQKVQNCEKKFWILLFFFCRLCSFYLFLCSYFSYRFLDLEKNWTLKM